LKLALDEVCGGRDARDSDRGPPLLCRPETGDSACFHEAGDPLTPDPDVVLHPQLGVDPRLSVDAAAPLVDLFDPLAQLSVRQGAIRRRSALPVMKAGAVHREHAAHHGDGIVGLLRGDEREHLAYRPSLSFAKKTVAFERISRSIRSSARPE
jgi:hypothetical protein